MLELAEMLTMEQCLDMAVRIADHYSLPTVANQISQYKEMRLLACSAPVDDIGESAPETRCPSHES
jgi:hypothetical protein